MGAAFTVEINSRVPAEDQSSDLYLFLCVLDEYNSFYLLNHFVYFQKLEIDSIRDFI
ncbi:hypothetical protein ERO13_D02G134366v2 [Gossypium hirsutum]|uniref:Uncharacterized protein n=1 Tax=Gossypium darwinii TaxID=34276 RepID=A0A5D2DDT6_GOSDA|nr:hypothetical protein ERO13_D02G134366v2 [Gossypium hirsutum]TYG79789.1 hypothetical protein ES288_D02G165000v1 [Gossypium darwinii]